MAKNNPMMDLKRLGKQQEANPKEVHGKKIISTRQ
jgi:hypothetical protein